MRAAARTALKGLRARVAVHATSLALAALAVLWAPMAGLGCLAIEYGHALKVRSELQDAADAAAEAGALSLAAGETSLASAIRMTLDARLRHGLKGIQFAHSLHAETLAVRIDAHVATWLIAAVGKDGFNFTISSAADLNRPRASAGLARDAGDADAELLLERARSVPAVVTSPRPKS
jgi:hypothetical protein